MQVFILKANFYKILVVFFSFSIILQKTKQKEKNGLQNNKVSYNF